MLRPRIIPSLLIQNSGLVKTTRFTDPKYVGDPINTVRIFNEKEVDELLVLDIDASVDGTPPNYELIAKLATECRMPLCYGGGISSEEQASKIIGLGVEKISLSAAPTADPRIVKRIAEKIGHQSVVVVIDVRTDESTGTLSQWTHNGKRAVSGDPVAFAKKMQQLGAGEIVVNHITNEGTGNGYDLELAQRFRDALSIPLTMLGGAASLNDVSALINQFGVIGAAAGSLFVFKGKYRAVLVNYPSADKKTEITG